MEPTHRGNRKKNRNAILIAILVAAVLAAASVVALLFLKPWEERAAGSSEEPQSVSESESPEETEDPAVAPESVSFSDQEITLEVGESLSISYTVVPSEAVLREKPEFYTKDKAIATVRPDGTVLAVRPGTTKIRMIAGRFYDELSVTVRASLRGIELPEFPETINVGEELALSYKPVPENTTETLLPVYSISDETLGSIDDQGVFTSKKPGRVTLTVTVNGFRKDLEITILSPLQSISIPVSELVVKAGDTVNLPLSYQPADTTDEKTAEWTSSAPLVASVDEKGNVSAKSAGSAVITAKCGELTANCRLTVVIPVTGVAISASSLTVEKGGSGVLSASLIPANTTEERSIRWSSDNINVARVENGVVTGVNGGYATITASHNDFAATSRVFVHSPVTGVSIDQGNVSILEGSTASLTASVTPLDATDDKTVRFSSDDPEIASVTETGMLTAVKEGETVVHARVGSLDAAVTVTVEPFIEVESVSLSASSISFSKAGESALLGAAVFPENASDRSVLFSSSDNTIATVDASGLVTAVRGGDCVITAKCGDRSAEASVHVEAGDLVVVLDPGHGTQHAGAVYDGVLEQEINMKVALVCKAYLESHYYGVTVYLTHETVECAYPGHSNSEDLEQRCQFAQDKGAVLLISLHHNMSVNHTASGCLAFVSHAENVKDASYAVGNAILSEISAKTGLTNLGCRATNSATYFDEFGNPLDYYAINRFAASRGIPGVIVEHCFMDRDTAFIKSDEWLTVFGVADAAGIAAYLNLTAR